MIPLEQLDFTTILIISLAVVVGFGIFKKLFKLALGCGLVCVILLIAQNVPLT